MITARRAVLAGAAALVAPLGHRAAAAPAPIAATARIAAIEQRNGGRLGVAMLDTASGQSVLHRPDERFAMCSTFKLLAAAAVLRQVDVGDERLDRMIPYGSEDLLAYAPVTKTHVGEGGMRLGALCAAAIDWSDNTAANLILRTLGGPAGWTRYVRSLGDAVTRLDRDEPTLNTAIAGDPRDTTSPRAMLDDMRAVLLGTQLSPASRAQLADWLIADRVGGPRLRAGLPASWRVGDKTGSGDNATANTLAILWPPARPPILVAVYYTGGPGSADARNAVHAEIGRLIATQVGATL